MKARFIPVDYSLHLSRPDLGAEVFISADGLGAIAYSGKKTKKDFWFAFKTKESADNRIAAWLQKLEEQATEKKENRNIPRRLVVGDILVSSWGYEQTNIDYYEVVALVGAASVEIREIKKQRVFDEHHMTSGHCIPVKGEFNGDPIRRRVTNGDRVKISSFQTATLKEFLKVAGSKVFAADRFTDYA